MLLLSATGFYLLIGLVVWIITLSNPKVRKVWALAAKEHDDLSAFMVLVVCLIWPIRLVYFIKDCIVRSYDRLLISHKVQKGNRMCEAYLDDLRQEELEAADDPERLKSLARKRQIVEKVEAVMNGLCPDCGKALDFSKLDDAAYCRNCNRGFSRDYDPRKE